VTYYSQVSDVTFALIKSKRRLIEPRLNDDNHRQIRPGDLLVMINRKTKAEMVTKIVGVLRYPSFVEMFHVNHAHRFGTDDARELLAEMHHYYTTEDEIKHGVLGLKLHVLKNGEK
jgi:ASC-1-like (ASCH) protein